MRTDVELIQTFLKTKDENAFADLVSIHFQMVYSTAMRAVGNHHAAEEIAQAVFIDLARKLPVLMNRPSIAGWLFTSTRFAIRNHRRSQRRRENHLSNFQRMSIPESFPTGDPDLTPLLDDALEALSEKDREALVLRFFQGLDLRSIGSRLKASDDAVQKRISRALEQLRKNFKHRGISLSVSAIASALSGAGLAANSHAALVSVTSVSLSAVALAGVTNSSSLILGTIFMTKTKTAILAAAMAAGLTTSWFVSRTGLREKEGQLEVQSLKLQEVERVVNELQLQLDRETEQRKRFEKEAAEVHLLRNQIASLKEKSMSKPTPEPASDASVRSLENRDSGQPDIAWIEGVLNQGPAERGAAIGAARLRFLQREKLRQEEIMLLGLSPAKLHELEKSPEDFSVFQQNFIDSLLASKDSNRSEQIRKIILDAAFEANEKGFSYLEPAVNADSWNAEQKELNRSATSKVQNLLTGEERSIFDSAFIGVLGVDTGMTLKNSPR